MARPKSRTGVSDHDRYGKTFQNAAGAAFTPIPPLTDTPVQPPLGSYSDTP